MLRYRKEIDGLRAIAVLLVLFFHFDFHIFSGGFIGVDVFFVISGYLITSILRKELKQGNFSYLQFYERRVRRIIPVLYFILFACSIAAYFILMPNELGNFAQTLLSTIFLFSNLFLWSQTGYFDISAEVKPLLHTWSLSIEEQFYLIYPAVLFIGYKFKRTIPALITLALLSFSFGTFYTHQKLSSAFYFTHLRAWEFLLGSLLAYQCFPKTSKRISNEFLGIIGTVILVLCGIVYTKETLFPGFAALLPCLGSLLILCSTEDSNTFIKNVLSTRPMTFIGNISYSLYLWHWPIIVFYKYYFIRELFFFEKLSLILISIILSYLSWKYIENPFRKTQRILRRKTSLSFLAISSLCLLSASYIAGIRNPGLPNRLDSKAQTYAQAAKDINPDRDQCHSMPIQNIQTNQLCTLGIKKEKPDFVVWGDSHADALMPLMKHLAEKNNLYGTFASFSACPPVLNATIKGKNVKHKCKEFNREMLAYIKRIKTPHVFFVSRWSMKAPIIQAQEGVTLQGPKAFKQGFKDILTQLKGTLTNVHIVSKIPVSKIDIPSYLARYQLSGRDISSLRISKDFFNDYSKLFLDMIDTLKADFEFNFIEPSIILCGVTSDSFCEITHKGIPLYRDHHHLSTYGAKHLEPLFNTSVSFIKKELPFVSNI